MVQRQKKTGKLDKYDAIIQEQLQEGVTEEAEMPAFERKFYIPHKAVVKESAETTKMRIVYDASARAYDLAPSLTDCLEVGPPLRSQFWKVLLRGKFPVIALSGDIRKAFLQARIREQDRDALRFHWLDGKNQRLAKQVLTIPRRELISGHIAVNLLRNVQDALQGFPITSLHCWLHRSVALHWILGGGDYEQFMANRVRKIRKHVEVS